MDKKEIILCDSNVLIDWINHRQKAIDDLQLVQGSIAISIVTEYEIIAGAKDMVMQRRFEKFLNNYIIISLDHNISLLGISLYKKYKLSHGLDMPDSLIAATAIELDFPLFTYNIKDFRFIPGIRLYPCQAISS
jgi:predicted nucleic acid-binding protein